jgi:hypothetical protein
MGYLLDVSHVNLGGVRNFSIRAGTDRGVWVLVHWAEERDATGDTAFVLRPEVVEALKRLVSTGDFREK